MLDRIFYASTRLAWSPAIVLFLAALAVQPSVAESQITGFDDVMIEATLTGDAVTPSVSTTAVGQCTGRLAPTTGGLDIVCSHDIDGASEVVLVLGSPGSGGSEMFFLGSGGVAGAGLSLNEDAVTALLTGRIYATVKSSAHPQGEIAARLMPRQPIGTKVMRFPLREDSLVYTGSSKTGHCILTISADDTDISLLCSHNVANPGQLRLIVDGGVVSTFTNVASPFQVELPVLAANLERFLEGKYGVVLTSAAFPNGEIGALLDRCIDGPATLCLGDDRFRVDIQFTAPGKSPAPARVVQSRTGDSGLFWFFTPGNWEALVKVLNACVLNQRFWVFLSANTNVAFEATVYDTLTGRVRSYANAQGNQAAPVADTSAFPCS